MRDWTLPEIHLCNVRLRLLSLNTMGALDPDELAVSLHDVLVGRFQRRQLRRGCPDRPLTSLLRLPQLR